MASPRKTNNLFPDSWVVGPAAAELARNDVGVLLADDPRAAERAKAADDAALPPGDRVVTGAADATPAAPETEREPPAARRPDGYPAEEIAELKRENERLQQRIAASRGRFDSTAERAADRHVGSDGSGEPATWSFGAADPLHGDVWPGPAARRPARSGVGRYLAVATLLLVVSGAGAVWVVGGRLAGPDSTPGQRLQAFGTQLQNLADRVDTDHIRQMTGSEIDGLRQRLGEFRDRALAGLHRPDALPPENRPPAAPGDPAER